MNKKINITFSIARIFAILSIVSAHIVFDEPKWAYITIKNFGSVGVIVFMILSGYYYNPSKYTNIGKMLYDKLFSLGIPWLIMGTAAYLPFAIANNQLGISTWLLFIIGKDSGLYYLTMLILCYIVFFKQKKGLIYLAMILTGISLYTTAFGLLDSIIYPLNLSNFLNFFNWCGYFAIGCRLKDTDPQILYRFLQKSSIITMPMFMIISILFIIEGYVTGYFTVTGLPYQLLGTLAIGSVSTLSFLDSKLVHTLSNLTFGVYLIHVPLIAVINVIFEVSTVTKLLAPAITVVITSLVLYIGYRIAKIIHIDKLYMCVCGVRLNRNIKEK